MPNSNEVTISSPDSDDRSSSIIKRILAWFDSSAVNADASDKINWTRIVPFIAMHLSIVAIYFVGFSWTAFWSCVVMYFIRMFAITGFYHRYFSHKTFKTSRIMQFIMAFIGASSAQRGPLWWASHHRVHHAKVDTPEDPHSPKLQGFIWSHMLWFLTEKNFQSQAHKIKDFSRFKELRLLDRFDIVAPIIMAFAIYGLGEFLARFYPSLNTNGWQLVTWGFFLSTIILYHATYTINSIAHRFGKRRFDTKDESRNNWLLATITLGEGWHNNHHHYAGTVRQGFKWYELDVTYYLLRIMCWMGLVWDLKPIPEKVIKQMAVLNK
jgi:stearoyl-CoA desaturase (delta-9 desaturase)